MSPTSTAAVTDLRETARTADAADAADTETSESTEGTDTMATTTIEDRPATDRKRQPARKASRHGHRRAPKQRRAPVRLLVGLARIPGWLVRNLRPSRLPWWGALPLGALIVAALVLDGLAWQSNRNHSALNRARGEALVAATSAAQKALSWDYRTLDADIARAKAVGTPTGAYLNDYARTTADLRKEAEPLKAIAQTTVQSGSVISASRQRVVVLLFADQAAILQQPGSKTPDTKIAQYRIQMAMVKQHGRWLVDTMKPL